MPACEWVQPVPVLQTRDCFRPCRLLPAGRPDCLSVSVVLGPEGMERCVAALYAARAYVIHYEFRPH